MNQNVDVNINIDTTTNSNYNARDTESALLCLFCKGMLKNKYTVELQWLEHLWDHENMFETGVVRANEY